MTINIDSTVKQSTIFVIELATNKTKAKANKNEINLKKLANV